MRITIGTAALWFAFLLPSLGFVDGQSMERSSPVAHAPPGLYSTAISNYRPLNRASTLSSTCQLAQKAARDRCELNCGAAGMQSFSGATCGIGGTCKCNVTDQAEPIG